MFITKIVEPKFPRAFTVYGYCVYPIRQNWAQCLALKPIYICTIPIFTM